MTWKKGAQYFRSRFVQHHIGEFKKDIDITKGKNSGQSEEIVAEFVANAYVRVVEWLLKNEMPYPWQKKWGFVRKESIEICVSRKFGSMKNQAYINGAEDHCHLK